MKLLFFERRPLDRPPMPMSPPKVLPFQDWKPAPPTAPYGLRWVRVFRRRARPQQSVRPPSFESVLRPQAHPLSNLSQAVFCGGQQFLKVFRPAAYAYYVLLSLVTVPALILDGHRLGAFAMSLVG